MKRSDTGRELSRQLGATWVFDYKKQNVADLDEHYDIIFDTVGKLSKKACRNQLAANGRFVTVAGLDVAKEEAANLEELARYFDDGKFIAVIDKVYPLDEIIEAHQYVDAGHKQGNVVITMQEPYRDYGYLWLKFTGFAASKLYLRCPRRYSGLSCRSVYLCPELARLFHELRRYSCYWWTAVSWLAECRCCCGWLRREIS